MSIEYIVEGKILTQTEGAHLTFAKENISQYSDTFINAKGDETGESYNSEKIINPNDKPINTLDVSLNLFFDGTQNNKTNTELGKDNEHSNHADDSYTNDYSNVARGYDAIDSIAQHQVSRYIEGIGTENNESETTDMPIVGNVPNQGVLFGTGSRGVPAKVSKGCREGAEALKIYAGKDFNLNVNVFGFSRGSAAARHFVHIATNPAEVLIVFKDEGVAKAPYDENDTRVNVKTNDPLVLKHGYFGACLSDKGIIPKKITFKFVGLYDTVASYGANHRGGYGINGDTEQLGLNSISKASFTLQIASDDEFRDNFDLTNINSAPLGMQFTFPGVHSDIGGCYVNKDKNRKAIYKENGKSKINCEKFREILIEEGWYKPEELVIEEIKKKNVLIGTKFPYNTYDKIPLNIVLHASKQFEVKYKETSEKDHEITDVFLNTVYGQLINYMNACAKLRDDCIKSKTTGDYLKNLKALNYLDFVNLEDVKTLRREYLHWSADVLTTGYSPIVTEVAHNKYRKRNIQTG